MKRTIFATVLSLALATTGFAQMGGGGMGGGSGSGGMHEDDLGGNGSGNTGTHGGTMGGSDSGGMGSHDSGSGSMGSGAMGPGSMGSGSMAGGGGMFTVADDSSLLIVDGHQSMQWYSEEETAGELVNIGVDGQERWRVSFEGGTPMMTVTAGDLIVVKLRSSEISSGEIGSRHGGMSSILIALDLVSGVQLWTFDLEESSMTRAQISEDGSIVYVIATDASEMGTGSFHQGDGGYGREMTSTLYALDRFGDVLWTRDLSTN